MGRFVYRVQESCWRDVFVRFDDNELDELIQDLKDKGETKENIKEEVIDWLKENEDEDYGDADDYETEDYDYDLDDDYDVYHIAEDYIDNHINIRKKPQVLGGFEDD